MCDFKNKLAEFFKNLGSSQKMILATSSNNRVTARMMSCVLIDGSFYFQTDKNFLKYEQMIANPLVALCVDNIQIEGTAIVLGHPLDKENIFFAVEFEKNYKGSFDAYSALMDEVLIKIIPAQITLWEYENNKPLRVFYDIENQKYSKEYYVAQ